MLPEAFNLFRTLSYEFKESQYQSALDNLLYFVLREDFKKTPENLVNLVKKVGRWYNQITISIQAKIVTNT